MTSSFVTCQPCFHSAKYSYLGCECRMYLMASFLRPLMIDDTVIQSHPIRAQRSVRTESLYGKSLPTTSQRVVRSLASHIDIDSKKLQKMHRRPDACHATGLYFLLTEFTDSVICAGLCCKQLFEVCCQHSHWLFVEPQINSPKTQFWNPFLSICHPGIISLLF